MRKKLTAICICVALVAIAAVNLSLAYFTDTDSADNVFTTKNVKIELIEKQRNDDRSDLEDFENGKSVLPAPETDKETETVADVEGLPTVENYVDKIMTINNLSMDAYVRLYIAVPVALDDKGDAGQGVLHFTQSAASSAEGQWLTETLVKQNVLVNGVACNIYYRTYSSILTKDEETATPAYVGFYMDKDVDFDGVNYTIKGDVINYDFSNGITIPVFAVGVQAAGFDSADTAIDAAFGAAFNPWEA